MKNHNSRKFRLPFPLQSRIAQKTRFIFYKLEPLKSPLTAHISRKYVQCGGSKTTLPQLYHAKKLPGGVLEDLRPGAFYRFRLIFFFISSSP